MYNCSIEITKFHDEKVRLTTDQYKELQKKKDTNRTRIKTGLATNGDPKPIGFWVQGSFAMKTVVQDEQNHIDLDDGLYFRASDLKGPNGGDLAPRAVKEKVLAAVDDKRFKRAPEILTNCVRVYYDAGYHVDIPVYRETTSKDIFGKETRHFELASSVWKRSDARAVTAWFDRRVSEKSPDQVNSGQLRRIVRLMKDFVDSRPSWVERMPSGFILSTLIANECYRPQAGRDDMAFYQTMHAMRDRLKWNREVAHPVLDEKLTKGPDDQRMAFLYEQLDKAVSDLQVLFGSGCNAKAALSAWGRVTNEKEFFDGMIDAAEKRVQPVAKPAAFGILSQGVSNDAANAVDKRGGGRYA